MSDDNRDSEASLVTSTNYFQESEFKNSPQRFASKASGTDKETIGERIPSYRIVPFSNLMKPNRRFHKFSSRSKLRQKESIEIVNSVCQLDATSKHSELFNWAWDKLNYVTAPGRKHKVDRTKSKSRLKLNKRSRTMSKLRRKWLEQVSEKYFNNARRLKKDESPERQETSEETKNEIVTSVKSKTSLDYNRKVKSIMRSKNKESKLQAEDRSINSIISTQIKSKPDYKECTLTITVKPIPDKSLRDLIQNSINASLHPTDSPYSFCDNEQKIFTAKCSKNEDYLKKAYDTSKQTILYSADSKKYRIHKHYKRCDSERYNTFKTKIVPPITNMAVCELPKVKGRRRRNCSFVRVRMSAKKPTRTVHNRSMQTANESELQLGETKRDTYLPVKSVDASTLTSYDKKVFIKEEEESDGSESDSKHGLSNQCTMDADKKFFALENTFIAAPTREVSTGSDAIDLNLQTSNQPKVHSGNQTKRDISINRINDNWVKYLRSTFSIRTFSKQSIRRKPQIVSGDHAKMAERTRSIKNCNPNVGDDPVKRNDRETKSVRVLEQEATDNSQFNRKFSKGINCNLNRISMLEKVIHELENTVREVKPPTDRCKEFINKGNNTYSNSVIFETKKKSNYNFLINSGTKPSYPKKNKYLPKKSKPLNSGSDLGLNNNLINQQPNSSCLHSGSTQGCESHKKKSETTGTRKRLKSDAEITRKNTMKRGEKTKIDSTKLVIINPSKRQNIMIKCNGKLNLYINKDDIHFKDDDDGNVKTNIYRNHNKAFINWISDENGQTELQRCDKQYHGVNCVGKTSEIGADFQAKKPCSITSQQSKTSLSNVHVDSKVSGDFIKKQSNYSRSNVYLLRETLSSQSRINVYTNTSDYGIHSNETASKQTGKSRTVHASNQIEEGKFSLGKSENTVSNRGKFNSESAPGTSDAKYEVYRCECILSSANKKSCCLKSSKDIDSNQQTNTTAVRGTMNIEESILTVYKSNTCSNQTEYFTPAIDKNFEPTDQVAAGKTQKVKLSDEAATKSNSDDDCSSIIYVEDGRKTVSNKLRPRSKYLVRSKSNRKKRCVLLTQSEQELLKKAYLNDPTKKGSNTRIFTITSFENQKNKTLKYSSSVRLGMRKSRKKLFQSVQNDRKSYKQRAKANNARSLNRCYSTYLSNNSRKLNNSKRKRQHKIYVSSIKMSNCSKILGDSATVVTRVDSFYHDAPLLRHSDKGNINSRGDSDFRFIRFKISSGGSETYREGGNVESTSKTHDNACQARFDNSLTRHPCSDCSSTDMNKEEVRQWTTREHKQDHLSAKFTQFFNKYCTNESLNMQQIPRRRDSINKAEDQNKYDVFRPSKQSKSSVIGNHGTGKFINIWKNKFCRNNKKKHIHFLLKK